MLLLKQRVLLLMGMVVVLLLLMGTMLMCCTWVTRAAGRERVSRTTQSTCCNLQHNQQFKKHCLSAQALGVALCLSQKAAHERW
jgi:ABC-type protease/lipase transport system fused ATPase/permease subunit